MTSILFTTLPSGIDSQGRLRLSVLVAPRLDGTSVGGVFTRWPDVVRSMAFSVQAYWVSLMPPNTATVAAVLPDDYLAGLDSSLWASLFGAAPVTPFSAAARSRAQLQPTSFAANTLGAGIRDDYAQLAASSPTSVAVLTPGAGIGQLLSQFASLQTQIPALATKIVTRAAGTSGAVARGMMAGASPVALELLRAGVYYGHGGWRAAQAAAPGGVRSDAVIDANGPPDFHQVLSALGDQPALLRKLGLIIDLAFVPPAIPFPGFNVRVQLPSWSYAEQVHFPTTAALHYGGDFRPQPSSADVPLNAGMLRLGDTTTFNVHTLDIDGSALKLMAAAPNIVGVMGASGAASTVPSLRSGGFTVTRLNAEQAVTDRLTRQQALLGADPDTITLYAEDLVRGYRVDVRTDGGPSWRSLCQRRVYTTVGGAAAFPAGIVHDEGDVAQTSVALPDATTQVALVHDAIFSWSGYSLVARRPGKSIAFNTAQQQSDGTFPPGVHSEITTVPSSASPFPAYKIATDIRVEPGTLPRLRYGHAYEFRARGVDLAGNTMTSAPLQDATVVTPALTYRRYEPVLSPTLLLQRPLGEGESVERLVIRSNPYDGAQPMNALEYAASSAATQLAMNGPYQAWASRHVAPPKVSVATAELHGMFDGLAAAAAYEVALKESGTYLDAQILDTRLGGGVAATPTTRTLVTPPGTANPVNPDTVDRGTPLAPGQYAYYPGDPDTNRVPMAYLPDPMASGVSIGGLSTLTPNPAGTADSIAQPLYGSWPEIVPFHLQLTEGSTPVVQYGGTAPGSAIVLQLPPATIAELSYGSTVADATMFALAEPVLARPVTDPVRIRVLQAIAHGRHWMVSPSRPLVLVHAVQKPMKGGFGTFVAGANTELGPAAGRRGLGETAIALWGSLTIDGPSTARIDVEARWVDTVDGYDPVTNLDGPHDVQHTGHVLTMHVDDPRATSIDVTSQGEQQQDFHDTKRHDVVYRLVSTTRFREYFPAAITSEPANITNTVESGMVTIASSSKPDRPKIVSIVPTFRWDTKSDGTRVRVGGGLRIYVDRPWYTTGNDERLAVLVQQPNGTADWSKVSVMGPDPIWFEYMDDTPMNGDEFVFSYVTPSTPAASAPIVMPSVLLPDGSAKVKAIGYPAQWSSDRKLWYFDVELALSKSYFPFIRLALARMQPQSVGDPTTSLLYLSDVVKADFAQLAADRGASVVSNHDGTWTVTVTAPAVGTSAPWDPSDGQLDYLDRSGGPRSFARAGLGIGRPPPGYNPNTIPDAESEAGHIVQAQVVMTRAANPGELDWVPVGSPFVLDHSFSTGTFSSAKIALPANADPTAHYRLMVAEYEMFQCDPNPTSSSAPDPDVVLVPGSPLGGPLAPSGAIGEVGPPPAVVPFTSRLVYADLLPLP